MMSGMGGQIPNFPGPVKVGTSPNQLIIGSDGGVSMEGTAKRSLTLRPEIDYTAQIALSKPTQVSIGVFKGFSFPIYNTDNEELFFHQTVPQRWDGISDITFHVAFVLSNTEDVGDNFKFQFSWEHSPCEAIVPVTSNDVEVEVTVLTGHNAQYDRYCADFVVDYDIDGAGNEILTHELLAGRLRRIDATNPDVDNEIIVIDWHNHYHVDKMFGNS